MSDTKFRCLCGEIIPMPLPKKCPGCGKTIRAVRVPAVKMILSFGSIVVMFGLLLLLILFLVKAL